MIVSSSFPVLSLEEANALIPRIEDCLDRLMAHKEACDHHHDQLFFQELLEQAENKAGRAADPLALENGFQFLESLTVRMEKEVARIRSLGGVLRDLDEGWVDFLGMWRGKVVFFCWKKGQKQILYFHPLSAPANARLPLGKPAREN